MSAVRIAVAAIAFVGIVMLTAYYASASVSSSVLPEYIGAFCLLGVGVSVAAILAYLILPGKLLSNRTPAQPTRCQPRSDAGVHGRVASREEYADVPHKD